MENKFTCRVTPVAAVTASAWGQLRCRFLSGWLGGASWRTVCVWPAAAGARAEGRRPVGQPIGRSYNENCTSKDKGTQHE
jgi:hypothetical protein